MRTSTSPHVGSARNKVFVVNDYVLGVSKLEDEPVLQSELPENWVTSDKPHYVLISPQFDRDAAIVSLYGWQFRVDLGPGAALPSPIVVLCQTDGTNMHIAMEDEAEAYLAEASGTSFSECYGDRDRQAPAREFVDMKV